MKSNHMTGSIAAGTSIRMADGSERPIEEVRLGEHVVTAEGTSARVLGLSISDSTADLCRLVIWGHSHLRVAPWQDVKTARGPVSASDLHRGDEVGMPKWLAGTNGVIEVSQFVTEPTHLLPKGKRWSGIPGRKGLQVGANPIPETITLDRNFGRLIGLFLAEGNCTSGKAMFSLCIDEVDTLAAEVAQRMGVYGANPHIRPVPTHNQCNVSVYGTGWTRIFSKLCGDGAGLKRLHPALTAGPRDFLEAVLSGWLDGDGHINKAGQAEGVSISPRLALGMYDIAQALDRHPVIVRSIPSINRYAKTRQPRWTVTMAPGPGRCRQDETHVWRKFREHLQEQPEGPLYGLTIESANSFVAEGIGLYANHAA